MATLKVQDLPKTEQEQLIAEAQEVGIRGILTGWGVETLKNKIAEEKAKLNGENEQKPEENEQKPKENEQKSEKNKQKPDENENENEVIVAGDGGVHEIPDEENEAETLDDVGQAEGEKADETPENKETPDETNEVETLDNAGQEDKPEEPKKGVVNGICHICRSNVIDGRCTGCGYEVLKYGD